MPGNSRLFSTPMLMKPKTLDAFTGRQLTAARPFDAKEKYAYLNPGEGRTGARLMRPRMRRLMRGRGMPVPQGQGQSFATYAPDDGKRIDAHTYGDTVAKQSRGFEGLDAGFYAKNPGAYGEYLAKVDAGNGMPVPTFAGLQGDDEADLLEPNVRMAAYGTKKGMPVPVGEPFIAGDPQRDGKPNPELIVPTAAGTHVIPLKGSGGKGEPLMTPRLPKLAYGTVQDLGAWTLPVVNNRTGDVVDASRVAFDADGRMVGAGTGMTPVAVGSAPESPAQATAPTQQRPTVPLPAKPTNFAALRRQQFEAGIRRGYKWV